MVIRGQRFLQGRRQITVQTPDTVVTTRTSPSPTSHENVWFTFAPMFVGSEEPLAIEGVSLPLSLDDPRRILRPLDPIFTSAGYFPHLRALSLLNRSVRTLPSKLHVPKKDFQSCVVEFLDVI